MVIYLHNTYFVVFLYIRVMMGLYGCYGIVAYTAIAIGDYMIRLLSPSAL